MKTSFKGKPDLSQLNSNRTEKDPTAFLDEAIDDSLSKQIFKEAYTQKNFKIRLSLMASIKRRALNESLKLRKKTTDADIIERALTYYFEKHPEY